MGEGLLKKDVGWRVLQWGTNFIYPFYLFSANKVQSSPPHPHPLSQKIYPFLPTTTDGGLSSFADCRLRG